MQVFFLNPLSLASQCHTTEQAEVLLRGVVECFEYLLPALQRKTAVVYYDSQHENKSLVAGEDFRSTVNSIRTGKGQNLRKLWFLYTRNHTRKPSTGSVQAEMEAGIGGIPHKIYGQIHSIVHREVCSLIGFGGSDLLNCTSLRLSSSTGQSTHANAHNKTLLVALLPQYKLHDKHRKEPYYDYKRNEHVAAMPLSDVEAQKLLLQGLKYGEDILSFHESSGTFYKFKITGGDVYHGFVLSDGEVSLEQARKLRIV